MEYEVGDYIKAGKMILVVIEKDVSEYSLQIVSDNIFNGRIMHMCHENLVDGLSANIFMKIEKLKRLLDE